MKAYQEALYLDLNQNNEKWHFKRYFGNNFLFIAIAKAVRTAIEIAASAAKSAYADSDPEYLNRCGDCYTIGFTVD